MVPVFSKVCKIISHSNIQELYNNKIRCELRRKFWRAIPDPYSIPNFTLLNFDRWSNKATTPKYKARKGDGGQSHFVLHANAHFGKIWAGNWQNGQEIFDFFQCPSHFFWAKCGQIVSNLHLY